ncbi:MAG TPA: hypothetical protein VM008_08190 [Phycisphaerae bacterium]|nr:hypothetical protein [Phycisphaerae bacterium]
MTPHDRDWTGNVEQTEAFFHQFMAYIFHTAEGRRMRGIFLRETLLRTFIYLLIALPLVILLWYEKAISTNSPTVNFCAGILLFDLAFGCAFLRTVYRYRARVKIVYKLYFGNKESDQPEEVPPDADLDSIFNQISSTEAPLTLPEGPLPHPGDDTSIEMSATFECARCQCEVIVPISELDSVTTCPCGGKLVQT